MSLKRPPPRPSASTDSSNTSASQSALAPAAKRARKEEPGFLHGQKVLIYQRDAPFNAAQTEEVMDMVTGAGGRLSSSVEAADLIITKIGDVVRLKNSLTPGQVAGKRVLHWGWLRESVEFGVAQPMGGRYELVMGPSPSSQPPAPVTTSTQTGYVNNPVVTLNRALAVRPPPWHNANLSCERWSPLVSPNDDLVRELGWIHRARWLGVGDPSGSFDSNALAYARAIAQVKAIPVKLQLKHMTRIQKELDHIGPKIAGRIKEFIQTGRIDAAGTCIRADAD